ncbi:MAG TPA: CsbD family protein [Longimicrobium sp.]|nr:CsbD family protein [Longimicrobium sp.]
MDERTLGERGADNSLKGKITHAAGHIKDALGGLTGDKSMQAEGKVDQVKGKLQDGLGEVQRDLDRGTRNDGL